MVGINQNTDIWRTSANNFKMDNKEVQIENKEMSLKQLKMGEIQQLLSCVGDDVFEARGAISEVSSLIGWRRGGREIKVFGGITRKSDYITSEIRSEWIMSNQCSYYFIKGWHSQGKKELWGRCYLLEWYSFIWEGVCFDEESKASMRISFNKLPQNLWRKIEITFGAMLCRQVGKGFLCKLLMDKKYMDLCNQYNNNRVHQNKLQQH